MKAFINLIKKAALYAGLLILFSLLSCSNDDNDSPDPLPHPPNNSDLKIEFAKGLLSAMKESKDLRDLLKDEALDMFKKNSYYKDYDLLYKSIKDKKLENNLSVNKLMAKHLGGKDSLEQILSKNRTLAILVPELPNKSFSAKLWNTEKDVPAVAILTDEKDIPFIGVDGTKKYIQKNHIPGFPILVIKDDERDIISKSQNDNPEKQATAMRASFQSNSNENTVAKKDEPFITYEDYKKAYENNSQKGWQRDYFYYGITPKNTNGSFNNKWKEHITSFSIEGGDKEIKDKLYYSWAEGAFEFRITANFINKYNHTEIKKNQVTNYFAVRPNELFDLTYKKSGDYYVITESSSKTIDVSLPLFAWDLHKYSSTIKISVEEVDSPEKYNKEVTEEIKFAANFEFKGDSLKKKGLQFGNKKLDTKTITHYVINHSKSSFLGEADINFGDAVVSENKNGKKEIKEYSAGICKFKIMPVKTSRTKKISNRLITIFTKLCLSSFI